MRVKKGHSVSRKVIISRVSEEMSFKSALFVSWELANACILFTVSGNLSRSFLCIAKKREWACKNGTGSIDAYDRNTLLSGDKQKRSKKREDIKRLVRPSHGDRVN